MIASRYNEKHSNFIIAITKSIFLKQFSILYLYKGLETHILNILKLFFKTESFFYKRVFKPSASNFNISFFKSKVWQSPYNVKL